MSQVYDPTKPQAGVTTLGQLYQIMRDHVAAATSNFSGTAFPSSPGAGQPCYRTDRLTTNGVPKLYIYTALPSFGESGWVEVSANSVIGEELVNARGTKPTLDQRLDVALNEDGTLKASTTLNPSQWYLPSLTFAYVSTTSFTVNGDQTDIYKQGRRIKINLSASVVYSEVVSATYGAPNTTIQILDAVLDNTLVSVEHSLFLPDWDGKSAISPRMAGNRRVVSKSADYTTTLNDDAILMDASGAARTLTVLSAVTLGAGRRQRIYKNDTSVNAVDVVPSGTELINGNRKYSITVPFTGIEVESDGTNLRTIDDSTDKITGSDILTDFTVSGLLGVDPGASLTMTIPGGIAYVIGRRVVKLVGSSDLTRTYTASKDTYVDISHTGAITYTEVNNGAGAPSVAANSLRLEKVVTNGTEITGVTDLRPIAGVKNLAMTGDADSQVTTNAPAQLDLGSVNAGDRILIYGFVVDTYSVAPSVYLIEAIKVSGSSTIKFNGINGTVLYGPMGLLAGQTMGFITGIINVVTSGTLVVGVVPYYVSGTLTAYNRSVQAFFIKKQ
jgi:hypothetical protein